MLDSRDAGFASFVLDAQVERMIHWADADKDGKISFSDYKKIINTAAPQQVAARGKSQWILLM